MRLRTLKWWRTYRKIWLALGAWALMSLLMLIWLGSSLLDSRGTLPKITPERTVTMDAEDITGVMVEAEGVGLEMACATDTDEISAYLYGPGFAGQEVQVYRQGDTAYVKLLPSPPVANVYGVAQAPELTLRVIIPKRDYAQIGLKSPWLMAQLTELRGDKLTLDVAAGQMTVQQSRVQQAELSSECAEVRLTDSKINDLTIRNTSGDTYVHDTRVRNWQYLSQSGDLQVESKWVISGVWQLASKSGDMTVRTGWTPYNLLGDLEAERGSVAINYTAHDWDALIAQRCSGRAFQGAVGQGDNILKMTTDKGHITVGVKP